MAPILPGHVLSATINPSSGAAPVWQRSDAQSGRQQHPCAECYDFDISSVTIDTHDPTGNTVYATVAGMESPRQRDQRGVPLDERRRNLDGISANLPNAPANSLAIDPQNANTVYIATDQGVYFTTQVANCAQSPSSCWSVFGSGLPGAPAVALSATPASVVHAGAGRGHIRARHLADRAMERGHGPERRGRKPFVAPFPNQVFDTSSSAMTVTCSTRAASRSRPTSIAMSGDFSETDNCVNAPVAPGASCAIQVTFTPQATGPLSGEMTIYANVYGGQLTVDLTGTGSRRAQ